VVGDGCGGEVVGWGEGDGCGEGVGSYCFSHCGSQQHGPLQSIQPPGGIARQHWPVAHSLVSLHIPP